MPASTTGMGGLTTLFDRLTSTQITTAYTGQQATFNTHGSQLVEILIDYTKGGETSIQIQVEAQDETGAWFVVPYQAFVGTASALVYSASASAKVRWVIRHLGRFEKTLRVSVKSTGATDTTTRVTVRVALGSSAYPIAGNLT